MEGYFFDRKAFGIQPRQIEKHAVAFANADGGELVIGIADDSVYVRHSASSILYRDPVKNSRGIWRMCPHLSDLK
ncbi:helix-turn-helix domain-containing protein [Brevibacillus sp. H7]|uniref:AlbA family DNA-binding domain-containing protein n=1 Tax=Brevibacillus sp. H7 TaxID=3349138 RepID=UPI003805BBA5